MARGSPIVAICLALVAACGPRTEPPGASTPAHREVSASPERLALLVAAHNARVARLETVESRGSLELSYSDRDGDHFDQCEFDVFLAPGGRGALRATKLGNNFLWIGGDGTRGWVFRLDTEPSLLKVYDRVADHDLGQARDGAGEFALLTPGTVRAVAGLQPIPGDHEWMPVAAHEPAAQDFELAYRSGPARVFVRFAGDGLPSSVRVLDGQGTVVLESTLAEYVPAEAANLAQGAWPRLPRRIEIVAAKANGRAVLLLDEPIAMAKRIKPRFFSLEELTAQFRPDRVEHAVAAEPGPADGNP